KNLPPNARDMSLIPKAERHPGEGNGNLFQYSCLGNSTEEHDVYDRELQTFQEHGDAEEIWFGEASMERWMQRHKIPLDASVLDIGAGNGVFLVELGKICFSKSCQHPSSALEVDLETG
uniref:EEF1A lysine methyltransferase 2 n=1 Tax=Capra hircus TaxID=9925 RepID=A0A8C2PE01_CAPHI